MLETGNSVIWPLVVIRPITPAAVNQRAPSGPFVIPYNPPPSGIWVHGDLPARRHLVDRVVFKSVNQRFPSGPATIWFGRMVCAIPVPAAGIR